MKNKTKGFIGGMLIAIPVVGIFVMVAKDHGFKIALIVFLISLANVACVFGGAYLAANATTQEEE